MTHVALRYTFVDLGNIAQIRDALQGAGVGVSVTPLHRRLQKLIYRVQGKHLAER